MANVSRSRHRMCRACMVARRTGLARCVHGSILLRAVRECSRQGHDKRLFARQQSLHLLRSGGRVACKAHMDHNLENQRTQDADASHCGLSGWRPQESLRLERLEASQAGGHALTSMGNLSPTLTFGSPSDILRSCGSRRADSRGMSRKPEVPVT